MKNSSSAEYLVDIAAPIASPHHAALFIEPNPGGVKYALSVIGKMTDDVRLPLVKVSAPTQEKIRTAMVHAGLIN